MSNRESLPSVEGDGHRTPNYFAGGVLDRAAARVADPEWVAAQQQHPEAAVVPVWRSRSLVIEGERAFEPVLLSPDVASSVAGPRDEWVFLGLDGDRPLFATEVIAAPSEVAVALAGVVEPPAALAEAPTEPPPLEDIGAFHDLHKVGAMLGRPEGSLLAYARALVTWSRRHRFCGRCGHPTRPHSGGHMRRCENELCEAEHFPRTDPAIIVLVEDGDRCLLGRKSIWPDGVYSTLAGFVEPGESLSEAVIREVREESGIEIGTVRYRSSQP